MNMERLLLALRGVALIVCAYVILGFLLFLRGDPAEGQGQFLKNGLDIVIVAASILVGTLGGKDILSVFQAINRSDSTES